MMSGLPFQVSESIDANFQNRTFCPVLLLLPFQVRLLHQLFDVHIVDGRLAMPVALEVDALAVRGESRRDQVGLARLVLAQCALAPSDAQEQQQRGEELRLAPTKTEVS